MYLFPQADFQSDDTQTCTDVNTPYAGCTVTTCAELQIAYNSDDCPGACGSKSVLCESYKTSYDNNNCGC